MDKTMENISKRKLLKYSGALMAGVMSSALSRPSFTHEPSKNPLPKSDRSPHGLIVGHGDFKYKVNYLWGNLDPAKVPVENCHDLDIDSKGRIVMVTDSDRNNFVIYNKDGKLLDVWGTQYPGAHSVKVANENGEDVIYIVDSGWVLNRHWDKKSEKDKWYRQSGFVSKLTMEGKLIYTIGHPRTLGIYKAKDLYQPTDIAIAGNGDLYITDGYGSDKVIQYDHNGKYIRHWGGWNNADSNYDLKTAHGIEIDLRNPKDPHLMISCRAQQALKMFSMEGVYRSTLALPGAYVGSTTIKGDHVYVPICWSDVDGKSEPNSGFITIMDKNNRVVSNPGGTEPHYRDGKLQAMQTTWDVFNHCHAVCVDEDENLYIGQWNANQTYPIKLERV